MSTTAGEEAALVDTELERLQALALLTARIPPFSELYADAGSRAAAIAAVAGPTREINEALAYLWTLYPNRIVAAGYVDAGGRERARVVGGVPAEPGRLGDVRGWPTFQLGNSVPSGRVMLSVPFVSRRAGVPVVVASTPVFVDGHRRAFVELELATSAVGTVLSSTAEGRSHLAVIDGAGTLVAGDPRVVPLLHDRPNQGIRSSAGWRFAVRQVPTAAAQGSHWYVVSAEPSSSALSVALAPAQSTTIALALCMFALSGLGLRRAHAATAEELAAEQQARTDAERRSRTDALTGLYNRRHAMEQLAHELARAERDHTGVGLLMIDIDHFKRVNDGHGHGGGDAVITEVGQRLLAELREWDTVARIGGEEYLVIAPGTATEDDIAHLGDRLSRVVAERPITTPGGGTVSVTVSVGAVVVYRDEGSAEYGVDRADRALYAAKRSGRNQLCRFSQLARMTPATELPECLQLAEALALTSDLRHGLPEGRSRMVAQLSAALARRIGLTGEQILYATVAGWLRDVGKLMIPDHILTKPGPLTEDEWQAVREHPIVSERVLRRFPELIPACPAVRHHHEYYDGSGYPDRLAGHAIPVEARIVALADAYSAIVCPHPYHPARSQTQALYEIQRQAGIRFDPDLVTALTAEVRQPSGAYATVGSGRGVRWDSTTGW